MSTQAPGPDGHRPESDEGGSHGRPPASGTTPQAQNPYVEEPYKRTSYDRKPSAGDTFDQNGPNAAPPYPDGSASPGDGHAPRPGPYGYPQAPAPQAPAPQGGYPQGGYPQAPYPQNLAAPGAAGQQPYAPGPYGHPYAAQKSRVVAGVLGILLGALGVHRFYLGFTTIGVIQILMSTVLIFLTFGLSAIAASIWGLVEGIMILVGAQQFQRDARGVPLRD